MKENILVWERLDQKTIEYCKVSYSDLINVKGNITGVISGTPVNTVYSLTLSNQWQIREFEIQSLTTTFSKFQLKRNDDGIWVNSDGVALPEFEYCNDIDISLTPFTNTLPIKRLRLNLSESAEIKMLYIDAVAGKLKVTTQRYTNMGNNRYLYEGLDSGFKAELEINDDGYVTQYAIYWKLLKFL